MDVEAKAKTTIRERQFHARVSAAEELGD